jgi:hypothetical protein
VKYRIVERYTTCDTYIVEASSKADAKRCYFQHLIGGTLDEVLEKQDASCELDEVTFEEVRS